MLSVSLLGAPRIERDGAAIEVDTRKATALVAYLAVTGRAHRRDALAHLLWPEYDHEHARGALRRTLSTLKKALGDEALEAGREQVGLRQDDAFWLDVTEFRDRVAGAEGTDAAERLAEAIELYRGDFLAGFALRDSAAFDDWQSFEADSLRREFAGALERLVEAYVERGDYARALSYARRWLGQNPLHEPAHRELMRLYALSGERDAAIRQYRECVRVLFRELGVAPLAETTELYRAIVENRADAPRPRPRRTSPATGVRPGLVPLVGRSAEWQALADAYAGVGPDGGLVALVGEAGIGKTRLAEDFVAFASSAGAQAIAVRCYEEERNLAFAPVAEAVRTALSCAPEVSEHWRVEAARLLPDLAVAERPAPLETPGAQRRFFEALTGILLAACAGESPGVLLFDDVHWADEASLDALTYLVRRLRGASVLVLLIWRAEEVGATHRLRRLLVESERAGSARAVVLRPLTEADVAQLVQLAAPAAGNVTARLYDETKGVPLFVVEYLRTLESGVDPDTVAGGVRDLLRARISSVSESAAQVLAAAAVIGRSFDSETVREASGRSDDEVVRALEELTRRGFVEEAGDRYDFRHEQVRMVVYEDTSLARRRLLHRRVAEALVERPRAELDPGARAQAIARHYQLAGREREAAEHFKAAGEHASKLYANAEALGHFETALALGHPDAVALHGAIGDVRTLLGDYGGALSSYEAAAAQARPGDLAGLEQKLGALHHRRGEWELADGHFEAALAALADGEHARRSRVQADRSLTAYRAGGRQRALDLARSALALAETAGDPSSLAQAHNLLGILAKSSGDLPRAREHLERSLPLAKRLGDQAAYVAVLNNLALLAREESDLERAVELTENALALCAAQGDRHREAALHNNLADLLKALGRPDEAMAHLKRAVALFAEVGEEGAMQPEIWKLVEW